MTLNNEVDTQVLIVGAGPCGLMLALELGRRGVPCILLDKKFSTSFNPQANATQARTMEHFRRHGFANEIRSQGLPGDHPSDIAYFTRFLEHELARLSLPTANQALDSVKSLTGSWSAAELPHRISQKYVEATLLSYVKRCLSVDLRFGWVLNHFEQDESGVFAEVSQVDSIEYLKVRAKFLIGVDGARSMVRQQLGILWQGDTGYKREFMGGKMLAVYLRAPDFYKQMSRGLAWMYVSVNSQRRALLATVDGQGEFAFHAAVHEGEDVDDWGEHEAKRIFFQALGAEIPVEILSVATWTAGHALVAEKFQDRRIFLGGDAAHLFTPTGGLGYNTAIEDAVNLGWKLSCVLKEGAPVSLLNSYEAERKPLAIRNTDYAKQFADSVGLIRVTPTLEENSVAGEQERKVAAEKLNAHVRLEFNIPGVTFGGRYDNSSIIVSDGFLSPTDEPNVYHPTAIPGGRAPHVWLDGHHSLFDSFNFEWTLLKLGNRPPDSTGFTLAAEKLGMDLKEISFDSDQLVALYEQPLILIRPDQVVAWRGSDSSSALAVLNQVTGRSS